MHSSWDDQGDGDDRLEVGRPRPISPELMTARQLVDAYREAKTDDDRAYALDEAESFLFAVGDDVSATVLATFFAIPATSETAPVFDLVEGSLAAQMPAQARAVVRVVAAGDSIAAQNALDFLSGLPSPVLARGLIATLAGRDDDERLKGAAASLLVSLGSDAAIEIFDALADREVRSWIVDASGCPEHATDAEVMRCITSRSVAR